MLIAFKGDYFLREYFMDVVIFAGPGQKSGVKERVISMTLCPIKFTLKTN